MNRKQLALKVSKHPIIELLKKDKSLTSSDIARLIVEELLSENSVENYVKKLEAAQNPEELEGVKKEMDDWEPYWYTTYNNLRGRYNERKQELENVKSTSQQQIKNILTRLANMLKNNNLLGENINKLVKVLNIKNTSLFGQKLAKEFNRQELSVLKAFLEKEENIQLAAGLLKKYATPADNPPNEPTEEQPQSEYKGLEALGLGDNEKLFITFLNKLKELNLIKEIEDKSYEKISRLYSEGITKVLRTFQEEEQKKLLGILSNEKILEFVKKIMVQPQQEPKEEPEQQEQPPEESPEKKEEDFTPDEDNIKPFISAVNIFQQEFYKQRKRKNQAKIINAVIDSIDKLVDDTNLEDAYVEVSQEEQELEEGIRDKIVDKAMSYFGDKYSERRRNEPVKTKKEEIKDFRAEFRTFLQRVNKTNKALEVFKKYADQGSALADDTKEDFMQLLKKLQQSIVRIINNIRKSLPKAEIQENEADPKLAKHQEVSQKYRKALKSLASLRDLLSDKPTSEKPEELIKNSYQELIDLSQHFPSVNPFNVGVKSKKDLKKYDAAFDSAVKNVKASLQNVLSFIKTFESDSDTLEFAIEGLEEFSAKIQSIFGVKSLLKSAQASESEEAARVSEPGSSDTSSPDKPSEEPSGEPSGGPTGEPSGGPTGEPSGDERIEVEPWWDEKEEKMVAGSVNAEEIKVFDKFLKLLKSDQLNESDIGEFEKSIGNNKAIDRAIAEKIKATYNKLNDAEKAVMDRLFKKEDIFKAMVNAVVRKYPSNRTDSSNISVDDLDITPQSPEDNSRSASEDDPSANPENPGGNGSQLTEEQAIIMTNIANYVTSLGAGAPDITVNTLDDYGNDASIIISPEDAFVFYSTPDGTINQKLTISNFDGLWTDKKTFNNNLRSKLKKEAPFVYVVFSGKPAATDIISSVAEAGEEFYYIKGHKINDKALDFFKNTYKAVVDVDGFEEDIQDKLNKLLNDGEIDAFLWYVPGETEELFFTFSKRDKKDKKDRKQKATPAQLNNIKEKAPDWNLQKYLVMTFIRHKETGEKIQFVKAATEDELGQIDAGLQEKYPAESEAEENETPSEQIIANKLKPLIREMLKKGR